MDSCCSRKCNADCTEVTAKSVNARVTCMTGHTPPMSHSAISKAASAFARRSVCIACASFEAVHTLWRVCSISRARCRSGSPCKIRSERAASDRARSNRKGEASAIPAKICSAWGNRANRSSNAVASPGARSVSHSESRCLAFSGTERYGPPAKRAASDVDPTSASRILRRVMTNVDPEDVQNLHQIGAGGATDSGGFL
jgi:hypothetical protein